MRRVQAAVRRDISSSSASSRGPQPRRAVIALTLICLLAAPMATAGPWSDPEFFPFELEYLGGMEWAPDALEGVDGTTACFGFGMRVLVTDHLRVGIFLRRGTYAYDGPVTDGLGPEAYDFTLGQSTYGGSVEIGLLRRRLSPFLVLQGGALSRAIDWSVDQPGNDRWETNGYDRLGMVGVGLGLEYQLMPRFLGVRAKVTCNAHTSDLDDRTWGVELGFTMRIPKEDHR